MNALSSAWLLPPLLYALSILKLFCAAQVVALVMSEVVALTVAVRLFV